jgi:soluble lytic murein transglycosylase-like protein
MKVGWHGLVVLALSTGVVCPGAILVHLRSGAAIEATAQTREGDTVQFSVAQGTIELPAASIERIEALPEPVPVPSEKEANQADPVSVAELLEQASEAQALPAGFVKTVAKVESGLHPEAMSSKGAMGLMQLMPETAADLGVDRTVPAENAMGGAKYLRALLLRYHGDARLALAAYNAGPGAVDRYHGIPPYPETIAYVAKVLREYERLQKKASAK